jgi:uncharacterized protein (DUF2267 family)
MTLAELIAAQRAALATRLQARAALTATLQQIRDNLTDPVPAEVAARITSTIAERTALDADIDQQQARIAELVAEQERDEAVSRMQREVTPAARKPAYDEVARVGAEERTYRPDTDPRGTQFLRDLGKSFFYPNNYDVRARLERHDREGRVEYAAYMDRAAGTGAFAGLTVPQYLTELYAPAAANGRGTADVLTKLDLPPDGMTVNLSRITTATSAAIQASENTAVSNTDIDDTLLTVPVLTTAGQQTLSRQAIDRGTGTEGVVMNDLFRRYHANLDSTLLNQASTGLTNVATSVPYVDATPTVAELYPKFLQALAAVEAALLDQTTGSDNIIAVMHSRRWYWLQNAIAAVWPTMQQPGIGFNSAMANFAETYGKGWRGVLPNGTNVIVDNNVGTLLGAGTEDEIYFFDRGQAFLWEDPGAPVFIRAEQPAAASLGVLYVVWGYYAYTWQRFTQAQKINGTGLIAPSFTGL